MRKEWMKRLTALVLCAAMAVSLAACGTKQGRQDEKPPQGQSQTQQIRLTDQAGREVVLEKPAETLVSCYYVTTYATIALGVSGRVIGLEKKADSRPIYKLAAPGLLEKEQVGSMKEFNVEAVAALAPELVLMPKKLREHADTLTELGIPVLVVDPETQDGLEQMLTLIGAACGVPDRAEALLQYYAEKREALQKLTEGADKPAVYMGGNATYLTAAPSGMYQSGLIELAGGENAAASVEGDYWARVSYEDILTMDPDVIVAPSGADYTVDDIKNDAQLAGVTAVQNGAVYQMPSGIEEWDSPIPSGILGAMWLTSALHPDRYALDDFTADAAAFYETFYGFTLDPALITK